VLFDVKLMESSQHRRFTGRGNEQILANLRQLIASDTELEVRVPVVPERNTDDANTAATVALMAELGVGEITLLPYNHLWEAKVLRLGAGRSPLGLRPPGDEFDAGLQAEFSRHGLMARV
jgi:pyruvate formate lyase activating enzyme